MTVLVIGGAGFIGSHLVDALIARGYKVRVLDNLEPQVHGESDAPPDYFNEEAEFLCGDVRDLDCLRRAVQDVEVIYFQAAAVGVGQSMYQIRRYVEVNSVGAANLLDVLVNDRHKVQKVIVASSMSIYGEGKYQCPEHGEVYPKIRPIEQLVVQDWEPRCPIKGCGMPLVPLPTDEDKPLNPTSIYAITKRDQEEMFLCVGRAYGIPVVALRYFNVYGSRQALSNPYTGVVAIFSARILNGRPPIIYEDGRQSRDFVHVSDVVQANLLAMEHDEANWEAINVGTGRPITVLEVAHLLSEHLGFNHSPEITQKYRVGDIRHCFADITKARELLGYEPKVSFAEGVKEVVTWVSQQTAKDRVEEAQGQLLRRNLIL